MPTVALITYQQYPTLTTSDTHLATALHTRGWSAIPVAWDDPVVDWSAFNAVVLRACWDYHTRPAEFRAWLARLDTVGIPVWNTPDVIRWNMRKTYLRDLAAAGINVVPTVWAAPGETVNLVDVLSAQGWAQAVVKPQISASAWQTWTVTPAEAVTRQPDLDGLIANGGALIQPLVPEIRTGEWSLIFFNGTFSHAVLKRPGAGSIFVQEEHGGSTTPATPRPEHVAQAMLEAAPDGPPLYARVDAVAVNGTLQLMELELIEPSLFLDNASAARFADALLARSNA